MGPINMQEKLYLYLIDFRLKSVRRDNEGHFILIKETIHQEEIPILYAQNIGVPNYIKKKHLIDLKTQIEPHTVTVGDLNVLLSQIGHLFV
jgi:hypothetical protein